jgi:hypothetical protein
VTRRPIWLLVLLGALATSCHSETCSGDAVRTASTGPDEKRAFQQLWRECHPLSLTAFARDGSQVRFDDPALTKHVHRLTISAGGRVFEHTLIDPENVLVLLRE